MMDPFERFRSHGRRPSVLTVTYGLGLWGTQRVAVNFSRTYADLECDVRVLVVGEDGPRAAQLEARGIPVHYAGLAQPPVGAAGLPPDFAPDIIHVHSHGVDEHAVRSFRVAWPTALIYETNVFALPSNYRACLDLSFQLTDWCAWMYGCRVEEGVGKSVRVLPNLVDAGPFYPDSEASAIFRATHSIPPEGTVFCRVAAPLEAKWSPGIIGAFERTVAQIDDAWLILVGAAPSVLARLARVPASVRSQVRVLSPMGDDAALRAVYSASDVFVHMAAGGESFGLVLAEAMLCCCPPLTLATPGSDNSQMEVVGNNIGGVVCATRDGFARAMIALHENPEWRKQLGAAGRARVLSKFTAEPVMAALNAHLVREGGATAAGFDGTRRCQALYRDVWDRPIPLVARTFSLRPHLNRSPLGDRGWRAIIKALETVGAGTRPA
jgi:glycosyltransferase involved in cell wall biosynthesis